MAGPLEEHGFDKPVLDEGYGLLQNVMHLRGTAEEQAAQEPLLLKRLDEYENKWLAIARVSLDRHFPQIAEHFFNGLSQKQGDEVVLSVGLFMSRLAELEQGAAPYGADGPAARELLHRRGLTEEREMEGRLLLEELRTVKDAPRPSSIATDRQKAVDDLWAWYLEWSTIARLVISDRRLLRRLGFGQSSARFAEEEAAAPAEVPQLEAPAEPAPLQLSAPAPSADAEAAEPAPEAAEPHKVVSLFDAPPAPALPLAGNDAE